MYNCLVERIMGIDLFPEGDVPFNRSVARKILTSRRRAMTTRCRGKEQPEYAGDYLCQLNGMEVDRHKGHYKSVDGVVHQGLLPLGRYAKESRGLAA
jgi:hypothetical protein